MALGSLCAIGALAVGAVAVRPQVISQLIGGSKASGGMSASSPSRLPTGMISQAIGSSTDGILSIEDASRPPTLESRARLSSAPLAAQGATGAATLAVPGSVSAVHSLEQPDASMPDDLRRWLEHLERIENKRMELAKGELGDAMNLFARFQADDMKAAMDEDDDSSKRTGRRIDSFSQNTGSMRQQWVGLLGEFESAPAPAECVGIRNNYDQVLRETGAMMTDIVQVLQTSGEDPQGAIKKLTAMRGRSAQAIDRPTSAADDGVKTVCDRYKTRKWFSLTSDIGAGVMGQIGF